MITCPWCGTNYDAFRTNCKNCGGPLPAPQPAARVPEPPVDGRPAPPMPPPPPRPIADSYAWRLLAGDGWAVAAFVFLLLGGIFALTGFLLTIAFVTAFVGIPFLFMGLGFLGGGGGVIYWRHQEAMKMVTVLRDGQWVEGVIMSTDVNHNVAVNGRNPWTIQYQFLVSNKEHNGKVTTLNTPGIRLQPGQRASVLYLQADPTANALYPHP